MPYVLEHCTAGNTEEYGKYYSARYGKRSGRSENLHPTKETVRKSNLRKAEKDLRRLMNNNFRDYIDALVTLDFAPEVRPESYEELRKRMQNFLQRLRRVYKKRKLPLRFIWVAEIGPKGGMHVHMMLSNVNARTVAATWKDGATHVDCLWSHGQYSKIASYFLKYHQKTEETIGRHLGRSWNPSQNLKKPVVTKTIISARSFREKIREKKGYQLDKSSVRRGVSEYTGLPYLSYTFVRD